MSAAALRFCEGTLPLSGLREIAQEQYATAGCDMAFDEDSDNVRERRFEVDQNFDGWRLDYFLANRMSRLSRTRAQEIARHGDIRLEPERRVRPSTRLRYGDVVILREYLPAEEVDDASVKIVYEDDILCVIDKPAGMLTHEAARVRLNTVVGWLHRSGREKMHPVHRLDRETSGLLVCATEGYVPALMSLFATQHPRKIYRALVVDPQKRWHIGAKETLTTPVGLDESSVLGVRMTRGNLNATTHVEVLQRHEAGSLDLADLMITIETGRQHQIRVHLAMEATPVAGDKLYTYDDEFFMAISAEPTSTDLLARLPFVRHALHAWKLTIEHPQDGRLLHLETTPGSPFSDLEK